MKRQMPRLADTTSTSASLALVLLTCLLISSRFSEWRDVSSQIRLEQKTKCSLEAARQCLVNCSAIKRATIRDLIGGKISLEEATSLFLALDKGWPQIQTYIHTFFEGSNDSEREARFIISMACQQALNLDAKQSLFVRLSAEF